MVKLSQRFDIVLEGDGGLVCDSVDELQDLVEKLVHQYGKGITIEYCLYDIPSKAEFEAMQRALREGRVHDEHLFTVRTWRA